ncbi:hypothetical protein [Nocardioides jiangxiensis]|uniref:Permuted papain-like amidase enzyme, YaeF/YiiX, C92 family n=1 Tax=Nocardioides jiangxiensis TaxID=3064524 RepID=A0ABT9B3C4_9ACTN|nr:hypothetical protein [Nocardioides sp. WY-20]MDO7867663.1 hypothetical protein [Nocardioides sp. WY-20]
MLEIHEAAEAARTGDLLLFRGRTIADRAIRTISNAPVNHVGVAIVIEDLPPLLLHAERSRKQQDLWTGGNHRGVQLHDLAGAVTRWRDHYRQEVWLRQLQPDVGAAQEDAALAAVDRLVGVPFPSMFRAGARWFKGRDGYAPRRHRGRPIRPSAAFCSEIVAMVLQDMGILENDRKAHWYDPGTFWSGAYMPVRNGWSFGDEVLVGGPHQQGVRVPSARERWR